MQASTDRATCSNNFNGQTLGLFVLVVYVTIMPKELVHLACVFIGTTSYLFYLLVQPSLTLQPSFMRASKLLAPVAMKAPEAETTNDTQMAMKALKAETTNDTLKTSVAMASDVETTDDESTGVSGDENHGTTSDDSSVLKKKRTASKIIVPANDNPTKPGNVASLGIVSNWETDSSMKTANTVCCPRFRRKKTVNENRAHVASMKQLVNEDEKGIARGATRKKLSAAAAPYVLRKKMLVDTARPVCSPCVPHNIPSPEQHDQTCWQWELHGFCPRGPHCRWEHPPTEKFEEQPQSYDTMWEQSQTDTYLKQFQNYESVWEQPKSTTFQKQFQGYETIEHLPTYVTVGFANEFFEQNGQTMVQTPAPGQCNTFFVDHSVPIANNSFCDDDNDDLLTDDGF